MRESTPTTPHSRALRSDADDGTWHSHPASQEDQIKEAAAVRSIPGSETIAGLGTYPSLHPPQWAWPRRSVVRFATYRLDVVLARAGVGQDQ
jgi:hypothetical protein